jgi:myo-inositol-1(or 4)-monophosphatase
MSADGFRRETTVAIDAVERALDLTRRGVGADEPTMKAARDVVTATDVAIEDAIRRAFGETLGHSVLGEERGGDVGIDDSSYWLVDPICGTRNFASGIAGRASIARPAGVSGRHQVVGFSGA